MSRFRYRLVIRHVEHDADVRAGAAFTIGVGWENVGVAPPYRGYRVAARLLKPQQAAKPVVVATEHSIRGWLPGARETALSFPVPNAPEAGEYSLAISIVKPAQPKAAVRLAMAGRDEEVWYPVSRMEVRKPE